MLAPRSCLSLTNTSTADEVPVAAGRAQQQRRRHRNSLYAATCLRALRSLCSAVTHEALHCSWRAQGGPRGTPFPNDLRIFDCWHSKFLVRHEKTQAKSISWVLPIQATQKGHSASQPKLVCQTVGCFRLTIILIAPKFLETLFRFRLSTSSGTCPHLLCRSLAILSHRFTTEYAIHLGGGPSRRSTKIANPPDRHTGISPKVPVLSVRAENRKIRQICPYPPVRRSQNQNLRVAGGTDSRQI